MLRFATLFTLSLALTACDKGSDDPVPAPAAAADEAKAISAEITPPPPAPAPKDSWIEVSNAEGRLKAKFPVAPQKSVDSAPTPLGDVKYTTLGAEMDDAYYAVSYSDYPQAAMAGFDVDKGLDGARDGAVNGMGGTLIKEEQLKFQGYPAREFEAKGSTAGIEVRVRARIVLDLPRLWQMLVVYPASTPPAGIDKFFDSLELTPGAAAPADPAAPPAG